MTQGQHTKIHRMKTHTNLIHLESDWGFFLGSFSDNRFHKNHALQLSIAVNQPVTIKTSQRNYTSEGAIIVQANFWHQLSCDGVHLILLFNPIVSPRYFPGFLNQSSVYTLKEPWVVSISKIARSVFKGDSDKKQLVEAVSQHLREEGLHDFGDKSIPDKRIVKGLNYLSNHPDRIVPLEEIADFCFLSPSRFLHLFKSCTGVPYRQVQLWNRLRQSVPYLQHQSITQTAHQFGFTDSSHYSRAFKNMFGLTPRRMKS
jgi:AraC-like DNA-binding protein